MCDNLGGVFGAILAPCAANDKLGGWCGRWGRERPPLYLVPPPRPAPSRALPANPVFMDPAGRDLSLGSRAVTTKDLIPQGLRGSADTAHYRAHCHLQV